MATEHMSCIYFSTFLECPLLIINQFTLTLSDYIFYKILITIIDYLAAHGYWFLVVGC